MQRANTTSVEERQTGKTTAMMLQAPVGALFIWCNEKLDYPCRLAQHLGRVDLKIAGPSYLEHPPYASRQIVIDHAAALTERQHAALRALTCSN